MNDTSTELMENLENLRAHLAEGVAQASCGEYVQGYSVERLITDVDAGA